MTKKRHPGNEVVFSRVYDGLPGALSIYMKFPVRISRQMKQYNFFIT